MRLAGDRPVTGGVYHPERLPPEDTMASMGKNSPPVDGRVIANGHAPAMAPFAIQAPLQVMASGPVEGWPQGDEVTPAPDPESRWRDRWRDTISGHRGWLAAVPIVLVNSVAFAGQLAFLRGHLPWPLAGQVLVAVTLESVAVYLAWQAHLALAADDSALRLRLAAYGFAAVIGVMNFSHYMAPHWRPTFAAVTFGLMSVSSPWLWSVHSRRVSRDALKARGLIEPHAVRLGATRWTWHPVRSWRVMFRATWLGEADPAKAVALPPLAKTRKAEPPTVVAATPEVTPGRLVQVAPEAEPEVTPELPVQVTPKSAPAPDAKMTSSHPPARPETTARVTPKAVPRRNVPATPRRISDADLKAEIRSLLATDAAMSLKAAAAALGRSRDRVRPLLEEVRREA